MIASGYQILVKQKADQRLSLENVWPQIFAPAVPAPKLKTLTEISGNPGIGRSELLFNIIVRTVIPRTESQVQVGKSCEAIFIDLSHKLDICDTIKDVLMGVEGDSFNFEADITALTGKCLNSIINMSCYSPEQFELTLDELEDILWDHDNVSLLAIDGLDAFYWDDCYDRLQRMSTHYKKLCQRLKTICQEHNICCIFTVDSNYLQSKSGKVSSSLYSLIDYKLKLTMKDDCLFLNDKPFAYNHPIMK